MVCHDFRKGIVCLWLVVSPLMAEGFAFEYRTTTDWGTGFNGQILFRNQGSASVSGWSLEFDFPRKIDGIWDARIVSRTGDRYVVRSAGWNDTILPGASVTFGFTGSPGDVRTGPTGFAVRTGEQSSGATDAAVVIRETGRWAGGYSATLTLANRGGQPLTHWTLRFSLDAPVESFWSGTFQKDGSAYTITPDRTVELVPAGGSVVLGFTGSGNLERAQAGACQINGAPCAITVEQFVPAVTRPPIAISEDKTNAPVNQLSLSLGTMSYRLSMADAAGAFRAVSSNPAVARASVNGDLLVLEAVAAGRTAIRIDETASGTSRMIGVRVNRPDGGLPGLPSYLALGSVSEDTNDHLNFWRAIETGPRNKRMDARYIYLNGGPVNGWDSWGNAPGSRAINYIRNSRALGMIPFFVFYNIPDGAESYERDLAHVQDAAYMEGYFRNLRLFLDIVGRESPDDMVGVILEPDFLGYLAQNAGVPASEIAAVTRAAYTTGMLGEEDPRFPNTVAGLVGAINYSIRKHAPQIWFGWQMNLWASPPGGWMTSIPGRGIIRKTDQAGIDAGREAITLEADAITRYYLDAGVAGHGAGFLSIDKYGLDAGAEPGAAENPAGSIWFWNSDHWHNYLAFVRAIHQTSSLPVVLWQLPVGRINGTREANPYDATGRFAALTNSHQSFEDSAPAFFFGDTFALEDRRLAYFAENASADSGVSVEEGVVTWRPHMSDAWNAGVRLVLFGAGVGASTSSVGAPPSDGYWWITKSQKYFVP